MHLFLLVYNDEDASRYKHHQQQQGEENRRETHYDKSCHGGFLGGRSILYFIFDQSATTIQQIYATQVR